jgi:hypothetical protein
MGGALLNPPGGHIPHRMDWTARARAAGLAAGPAGLGGWPAETMLLCRALGGREIDRGLAVAVEAAAQGDRLDAIFAAGQRFEAQLVFRVHADGRRILVSGIHSRSTISRLSHESWRNWSHHGARRGTRNTARRRALCGPMSPAKR